MATALQVNDILALRAWTTCSEQAAVNTYNFEVVTLTGGAVTDQDVVNQFEPVMATFYTTYMPSSARFDGVQAYFMRRPPGFTLPGAVKSIASAGPGTNGTDSVPRQAAAILKYDTLGRGPGARGRVYLPFASTANVTAIGEPIAAFNVLIDGFATVLNTPTIVTSGGSSVTLVWGIKKRQPKPAPPTFAQMVNAGSAGRFGQQHKRGDYGRANQSPI